MVESINNSGSAAGLASLLQANLQAQNAQKRIATALRVAGATDDASSFGIAQGIRADLQASQAVQQGIDNGRGLSAVTEARGVAIAALNPANTQEQANILVNDFNALVGQIGQTIGNADFNGTNLLEAGATDQQVLTDASGGTQTLTAQDLQAGVVDTLVAGDIGAAVAAVQSGGGGGAPQNLLDALDAASGTISTAIGQIGAEARALESQGTFLTAIDDATTEALGAVVDADLARESTLLAAGQVKQQLALTSLSIANSQPQVLVSLFQT